MTLRQLVWAAAGRSGFEGELVAWLIRCIPAAIWAPKELPKELNPFREAEPPSEAMKKHLASWAARRWRSVVGSAGG